MLTQDNLKKLLHYSPDTGVFTWLVSSARRIKIGYIAGCIDPQGYRVISVNKRLYQAHRLAFLYMTGGFPENDTDHINGFCGDNRWCNLRSVTNAENRRNQRTPRNNTSGIMGVSRSRLMESWRVDVKDSGKQLYRSFSDSKFGGTNLALMAASFYAIKLRQEIGYHENHGRVI